jgi:hypothetical protein
MSHVQMIALKALKPSPLDARRIDKKIAIDDLAASILAHGLLQELSVVAVEKYFINADYNTLIERREILLAACTNTEPEWFTWCMAQTTETLLEVQAILIASSMDLSHSATTPHCTRKQAIADALATRLQVDMTQHWAVNIDYFMGLTKAQIITAIEAAPVNVANTDTKGKAAFAKHLASQKKDDLAVIAMQALEGTGWLPDVIATKGLVSVSSSLAEGDIGHSHDHGDPCFAVTDDGLAALASADAVAPDFEMAGVAA